MIGQVVTGGADLWRTIEHASLVATIIGAVIAIVVARRKKEKRVIEPDPLRVRKVSAKANEDDCKERHMRAMEELSKVAEDNRAAHVRIYDQIDEVEKRATDRLDARMEIVNDTMRKLPAEVLNVLRATGQLKDHHG